MSVQSQNIFAVLEDSVEDATISAPPKIVEKTSTHTTKRNTDGLPPSRGPVPGGNRRGGALSGNEAAFRDRNAGRESNRGKPTEEPARGGRRGGFRGGRGGRREEGDRHPTKSAPRSNSEKQAAQSWGATEGQSELKDEQAGADIAESEQKAEETPAEGQNKDAEPEEKQVSFAEYMAQLAEKKQALEAEASLQVRKPNEGVKDDKWKDLAPLKKDEEQEELFAGSGGKAKRERERKTKQLLDIDLGYKEPERTRGGRGGRGGARGDAGRGRGRGGGAPPRAEFRGAGRGRGQENQPINTSDESAFPSLGSSKN